MHQLPLKRLIDKFSIDKPKLLFYLALCLLSACSTLPNAPSVSKSWHAKGKIGINSEQHKGSAWINWQQNKDAFQIQLSGPLGFGAMNIEGNSQQITLSYKGKTYSNLDHPKLQQITGLNLPLQHFPFWAQGKASPYANVTNQIHQDETLSQLEQADWQVLFFDYRPIAKTKLPRKIKLQHQQTKLTLIIKSWTYQ